MYMCVFVCLYAHVVVLCWPVCDKRIEDKVSIFALYFPALLANGGAALRTFAAKLLAEIFRFSLRAKKRSMYVCVCEMHKRMRLYNVAPHTS